MEEEKKEKGFVVRDRRLFDESGETRGEDEKKEEKVGTIQEEAPPGREAAGEDDFPPVTFANFILSLSTTAMFHFGDFPDPATGKGEVNLPAAKQTIDIIGMLKTKTEGNLDDQEKNLIDQFLFELRMRYVKAKEKK
jgi:hypothetical protein